MQSVVNGLKQQYQDKVKFTELDYYEAKNATLVQQLRVQGHPTIVLLDGQGKTVKKWVGVTSVSQIETSVKQVLSN